MKRGLVLGCVLSLVAGSAHGVPLLSGAIVAVAPPPSVLNNVATGNVMWFFQERSAFAPMSATSVDISSPTTVSSPLLGTTPGSIAAGTAVNIYFIHHKPSPSATNVASVTFSSDVLGVILSDALLDTSDGLGNPGTLYPTGQFARGTAELGSPPGADFVTLSADRRTVNVTSTAGGFVDQVRILVAVPEPAVGILLGGGLLLLVLLRRAGVLLA